MDVVCINGCIVRVHSASRIKVRIDRVCKQAHSPQRCLALMIVFLSFGCWMNATSIDDSSDGGISVNFPLIR